MMRQPVCGCSSAHALVLVAHLSHGRACGLAVHQRCTRFTRLFLVELRLNGLVAEGEAAGGPRPLAEGRGSRRGSAPAPAPAGRRAAPPPGSPWSLRARLSVPHPPGPGFPGHADLHLDRDGRDSAAQRVAPIQPRRAARSARRTAVPPPVGAASRFLRVRS